MAAHLSWQRDAEVLSLAGELNSDTLLPLWQQSEEVVAGITTFDFAALKRVDTAGLALLIHLTGLVRQRGNEVTFRQMNDNLRTLGKLYNLPESLFPQKV